MEAALGLDLPAFVRRLPAFDWIRYLACEHIGLLNDIFSIAKDRALDNTNAVALVRREQQCDLDTAAEYVNTLLTHRIEAIAEQEAALSRQLAVAGADSQLSAQVQTWLAGIKSLVRGNHDWHCNRSSRLPKTHPSPQRKRRIGRRATKRRQPTGSRGWSGVVCLGGIFAFGGRTGRLSGSVG